MEDRLLGNKLEGPLEDTMLNYNSACWEKSVFHQYGKENSLVQNDMSVVITSKTVYKCLNCHLESHAFAQIG